MSQFTKHPLGHSWENESFGVFFGNKNSTLENLTKEFSTLKFSRIKQIHSDVTVLASQEELQVADAHFTQDPKTALLISTADCLPVLMVHSKLRIVLAIHAGWRGVAHRIVPKALQVVSERFPDLTPDLWTAFIGPHIHTNSFEVENKVRDQLLLSTSLPIENLEAAQALGPEKSCVNLDYLMESQLIEAKIKTSSILRLKIDTKTSLEHHSHRRDRELSGRNLSFIYLK